MLDQGAFVGTAIGTTNHHSTTQHPMNRAMAGILLLRYSMISVTILGDLLDFGHLFKAFGNN